MRKVLSYCKKHQRSLKVFALIGVLILFAFYATTNWNEFNRLRSVNPLHILLIIIGQLLILLSSTLMFRYIIFASNQTISLQNAFRINAYSALVNFFGFLQGGVGVRAAYAKAYFKIPIKKFIYFTFIQYVTLFYISFLLIVCSLLAINNRFPMAMYTFLGGILGLYVISKYVFDKMQSKYVIPIRQLGLKGFVLINLIQILGCLLAYGIELAAIGANFSLSALVLYAAVTQFSVVLAVTPGALGIKEGLLLIASSQMALSVDDILLSSVLDRLVLFLTFCLILPFAIAAKQQTSKLLTQSTD